MESTDLRQLLLEYWPFLIVLASITAAAAMCRRHNKEFNGYTAPSGWRHIAGGPLTHEQRLADAAHAKCQQLTREWHEARLKAQIWHEFLHTGQVHAHYAGFEDYLSMARVNRVAERTAGRIQSIIGQNLKKAAA